MYMAESASGEDEASVGHPSGLNLPILPARDFLRWSRRRKFSFLPYDIFSIDQACSVLLAVYWPLSFLRWRFYWIQLCLVP